MKFITLNRRTCLNLIGGIILFLGLGSAIFIYRTAEYNSTNASGYEEGDETVYPTDLENSKKFSREMEVYGGKANVLAYKFRIWFVGLWHGKSLAYTTACITILISILIFYAANSLLSDQSSDIDGDDDGDGTA